MLRYGDRTGDRLDVDNSDRRGGGWLRMIRLLVDVSEADIEKEADRATYVVIGSQLKV